MLGGEKSRINGRKGGRPIATKTLITQKIKDIMAKKLYERISPIIDAQLDSALGVTTEHFDRKKGNLFYVEHEPNVNAARLMIEQVVGRATEKVELSGREGAPLIIRLDT